MGILPIRELARILRATLTGGSGLTLSRQTGLKIKIKSKAELF